MRRLGTLSFAALVLAPVVAFVVLAAALVAGKTDPIDLAIEGFVSQLGSAPADAIMKAATFIGEYGFVVPVVALVAVVAWVRGNRRAAIVLAVDSLAVIATNIAIKHAFARPRPTVFSKIALPSTFSFPSGHSMAAMGIWALVAVVLSHLFPRGRCPILIGGAVLVIAIGVSRVYLGVHWPMDVLGAYLAGAPFLLVSVRLLRRPPGPKPGSPASAQRPA